MQNPNNILTMNTESRFNCLPPLNVCYPVSPAQRLSIFITPEIQTAYLQTFIHNELAIQVEVPLSSPFDLRCLFQKASYHQIPSLLRNNFTIQLSKGIYTLFPILRGGGGALTCARPQQKKDSLSAGLNTEHDDRQFLKNAASQKKQDIKIFYLPERDECLRPDEAVQVGPFYEELVDRVFTRIERESSDKIKLSTKKFRKYMNGEIQAEEAKMLKERFEESFKEKRSLAEILWSLVSLIRKDLYLNPRGKASHADVLLEELHPYEEKILLRMITSVLLKKVNPYVDETEGFERKVAAKLGKYTKHMIKKLREEKGPASSDIQLDKSVREIFTLNQRETKTKKVTLAASKVGRYRTILSLPYDEGVKTAEVHVLRGLTWNKYTASLLVKHYNAITDSTEPIDKRNKVIIEEIVSNMLVSYQEKEDGLTAEEIGELVGLGGIKHQPKDSKEMSLFQRLLSQFVSDINNDLVFDSLKIQALATIIYQCSEDSSRINDDLKQCMDVLHRQVERRLFTAENQNMQDCMDALNLVLYTMASKKAKGLREQKEMAGLAETFKDLLPSGAKNAFSLVFGNVNDPSLQIKAKYAQEALKRIGKADSDLTELEAAILEAAPAVISIVSGVFSFNANSVINGLTALASQGLKVYAALEKDWYEEVNKVYFLANMEFEEFGKRYFDPASKVGIRGQELAYYITRELHKIARTTTRMYTERKKVIEWLGAVYEAKTVEGEKLNHFSFPGKREIKQYIHKCLSDLARMPQEENISFDSDLADIARQTLRILGLEALKQDTPFEFVLHKVSDANGLLLYTLKSSMTLEYALSMMYANCRDYYEKEIKHLDYIEIEGEKYINKAKLDKREVLWSSSTSHALDTFLVSQDSPVLLIQGDAGTGKSTFLKIIEYQQWKRYKQGQSEYIPIFVRLAEIVNPAKCLTETFQALHFSHKVLEQFKEEGSKRSYLFIFDGYDELKAPKNLYEVNKLFEYGNSAKMIVTSREEYLKGYGNYMKYFRPKAGGDLLEYRITPLAKGQREFYFHRRVLLNRKIYEQTSDKALKRQLHDWLNVEKYINTIRMIPGLEDLIKTPYMLTIITNILPSLESDTRSRVTKASIYKVFTMKGFEVEMNRILENSSENLPKGVDLEKSFYEFAKDLAINLYLTDRTSITAEGSTYVMDYSKSQLQKQEVAPEQSKNDEANRFARFFSDDPKVKLARSGVPITMMDGQVRFNHKSIMEYFAARCLYDELKFCPADALHKRSLSWKFLKEDSQTRQESDVLNFLKEMIADNDFKQTNLKDKVELEVNRIPASPGLSPERDVQASSPMKTSTKLGSPLKSGTIRHAQPIKPAERLLYIHKVQTPDHKDLKGDKEDQKGIHVIEKLREALRLRAKGEITSTFYINLIMITSSYPDVIELLDIDDLKSLEQLTNVAKEVKEWILLALAKHFHGNVDLSDKYAVQHLKYKLKGEYHGAVTKEPKGWVAYANGVGRIKYDNEDFYTGSFVMDKKQGYGVYTFAKDDTFRIYDGYWNDDMFDGEGKAEFIDHSIYYGNWKQGLQHSMGVHMQCVMVKNVPMIVEVYRGSWHNGKKHGFGAIFLEGYSNLGYKAYCGLWEHGVLVKGEMVFKNGAKAEGTYSYDQGFKASAGKLRFDKDFAMTVIQIQKFGHKTNKNKDAQLKNVGLKDAAKDNNDPDVKRELLVKDNNGNSRLLLLCRIARSWVLNKVLPLILELKIVSESFTENNQGENVIHMLICNESVSLQFKNVFLERLSLMCSDSYIYSLLPYTQTEVPLVYAAEKLRMLKIRRKNVDLDDLKYLLMTKLAPSESPRIYIIQRMKKEGFDPLTLALAEFSKRINHELYLGVGSSSVKMILKIVRELNDKTLASLLRQNEEKLLLKLIQNQFFFLGGKNLRLILLSKMMITTDKKEKKTVEQLVIENYKDLLNAPLFQISSMASFPQSKIRTTLMEDIDTISDEYFKFLLDLIQEFLEQNISGVVSKETWTDIITRPLFAKVVKICLSRQSSWERLFLWLKTYFTSLGLGEESLHEMVKLIIRSFGEILADSIYGNMYGPMILWLATPSTTKIYSSIKYCAELFINYYPIRFPFRSEFSIYRWFEDYFQVVGQAARNNKIEDFKLEELEKLILNDEVNLFRPLLLQSLVVTAIEIKDAKLAIRLLEKSGQWIEKLHYWQTLSIFKSNLLEAPDSTKVYYENKKQDEVAQEDQEVNKQQQPWSTEVEDIEECSGIVRDLEVSTEKQKAINEFTGLNEKYKYTFYKDQIYFAETNLWNVLVLPKKKVSGAQVIKITEGVAIVEIPEGYYNSSYFKLDREVKSNLLECVTHESMREVLEVLGKRSIHIPGLCQYVMSKPQRLALNLFFNSEYLMYDQDYVHKCVTGQDVYPELQEFNYFDAVRQYVVEQYTNAFYEKITPSSVLSQPNIVKITEVLLRSSPHTHRFFKLVLDSLIAKLVYKRKDSRKEMLFFLQEVISSLHSVLQNGDYAQLCYDAYTSILAALKNDNRVVNNENPRSAKNLEAALNLTLSQVQALEAEMSGGVVPNEGQNEKVQGYKEKKEAYRVAEHMKRLLKLLDDARLAVKRITLKDITEIKSMINPSETIKTVFKAVVTALGNPNPDLNWKDCLKELADPLGFLNTLVSINLESISQDTIGAVERILLFSVDAEIERISSICGNLLRWIRSIFSARKFMNFLQSQNISLEKQVQLEKDYLTAKADFEGLCWRHKNQEYTLRVLSDKAKELSNKAQELQTKYKEKSESKTKNVSRFRRTEEANIHFQFFVDTVWKQLPSLPPRKATSFLFNWIDSWLEKPVYSRVKPLIEAVCSGELTFEDITPFAMLIYERLLAFAILTGSRALALSLLAKLKGKLKRVKAWKIPLNRAPNMSEAVDIAEALKTSKDDAENVKADKSSDLNARDKRLKYFAYESQIFAFVPTASDLEGKVVITHETEDVVMIVEESNDSVLLNLAKNNMTDVLVQITELGIYVGDFEGLFTKDLSMGPEKILPREASLKDFELLCKLSRLNYPLSKIAQAKLSSPEKWICKDVRDYLKLLVKYPESHDDPLAWLLKSGVKAGVLKKILGSINSEEKAKHFFNDFVCRYTSDPIKFIEEILLGNLVEKHFGMIFPIYLQLINDNPTIQNKFAQVSKQCIFKGPDASIAQGMILHVLQFPEQCPELDQLATETLKKCEDFFDCVHDQLVKHLLHAYLSGRKTASQTKRWVRLLFERSTTFVGANCSEQELVEVLVYNLFKSFTDTQHEPEIVEKFFKKAYNKRAQNLLSSVSSLFDAVLGCMAYEVTMPAEGCFTLVKADSEELMTKSRLSVFYKELVTLAEINKIALPNASTCKGYTEFVKNTAISLPSTIDVISFFILNIQVIMHLHLIEELQRNSLQLEVQTGDHSTIVQFAKDASEPVGPIKYSAKDGKKTIEISYFIDASVTLPSPTLFKTNTDNFCQVKSALFPETMVQQYDPFLASICCLHDSLSAGTDTERVRSSLQQAFPYFGLSVQQSSKTTLTEQLVYNSLYCLCMKAKANEQSGQQETPSAMLQIFERVKDDTSLLELALSALGIEVQFASAETITIKHNGNRLCSENDMLSLKTALVELVVVTTESLCKTTDNMATKCGGHQHIKEELGISLPEDLNALNFCLFNISLAHRISSIFEIQASPAGEQQIPQGQSSGLKVNLVEADNTERLNSLLSSSEKTLIILQHKIRKIKRTRAAYILELVGFSPTSTK